MKRLNGIWGSIGLNAVALFLAAFVIGPAHSLPQEGIAQIARSEMRPTSTGPGTPRVAFMLPGAVASALAQDVENRPTRSIKISTKEVTDPDVGGVVRRKLVGLYRAGPPVSAADNRWCGEATDLRSLLRFSARDLARWNASGFHIRPRSEQPGQRLCA